MGKDFELQFSPSSTLGISGTLYRMSHKLDRKISAKTSSTSKKKIKNDITGKVFNDSPHTPDQKYIKFT